MMRLSKTAWLILGIGIFVIAVGSLYMVYSRQASEQSDLNDRLSAAQATLPTLVSERQDLENALAQATSLFNKARLSFPDSVDSIRVDEKLFKIADDCDLEITRLTSSKPTDKKVEGITYSVASFIVDIEGEAVESAFKTVEEYEAYIDETVDDILDFVNTIRTDKYFTSATVDMVNMKVPEATEEELEKEITEIDKPSATIKLVVYSYQGE